MEAAGRRSERDLRRGHRSALDGEIVITVIATGFGHGTAPAFAGMSDRGRERHHDRGGNRHGVRAAGTCGACWFRAANAGSNGGAGAALLLSEEDGRRVERGAQASRGCCVAAEGDPDDPAADAFSAATARATYVPAFLRKQQG
jgi:hypothetical protein